MLRFLRFFLLFVLTSGFALGQAIAVPSHHFIYYVPRKMECLHVIQDYRDAIRSLSRKEVARFLIDAGRSARELGGVDLRRLTFYTEEFGYELGMTDSSWTDAPRRWDAISFPVRGGQF